jgi:CDP-diacylglycerol--serine O-phosphatidyltransferase
MTKLLNVSIADIFTITNGALGFIAIFFILQERIDLSFNLILLSVLADGMDGIIARKMGLSGGHLDELADVISFTLAPSVMIYIISDLQMFVRLATCFIFFICGIIHLIRYYFGEKNYFIGITTPSATLCVIILMYVQIESGILVAATIIVSILMISPIFYPRLEGRFAIISAALIFLTLLLGRQYGDFALIVLLAGVIVYIIFGPFYRKAKFSKQKIHSY